MSILFDAQNLLERDIQLSQRALAILWLAACNSQASPTRHRLQSAALSLFFALITSDEPHRFLKLAEVVHEFTALTVLLAKEIKLAKTLLEEIEARVTEVD